MPTEVINICAPWSIDPCDSYGSIAIELARHLTRMGVHSNLFALNKRELESQDTETAAIVAQPMLPAVGGIFMGWPDTYISHTGIMQVGRRVAVTMFESTRLPAGWAGILNQMDAVIVPSMFCVKMFKDSGVTTPIHVVPLGIGETFKAVKRDTTRKPLRILAFMDRGRRKGGHIALHAFLRAFGNDPAYRLVLKMRRAQPQIQLFPVGNVELIQRDMSDAELCELYQSCDVCLAPTNGEGFGLIPRQAAACGCISLATAWGGTADDLNLWGWPLPYEMGRADWLGMPTLETQDLGEWAIPCVDEIAQELRHVARYRAEFAEEAQRRAGNVHRLYSWSEFAGAVYQIWRGDW